MVQIIPAILARTEEQYKEAVEEINSSELSSDLVHIDFADGEYVDNKTIYWGPIEKYPLKEKEAHLMVKEPTSFITRLSQLGFKRVLFHLGVGREQHIIEMIKQRGMEVGLVLNPETPVENLVSFLGDLDLIQIMGVHPGFQGQDFIPEMLDKIKKAADLVNAEGADCLIGVDGGVNEESAKLIVEAGADYLVVGSHILKGNIHENIQKIQNSLN